MRKRSLRRTLFIYLAYAFLLSSVLAIAILLAEYTPSTNKTFGKVGIGVIVLNSVLWNLFFTIMGSLSLLNQNDAVNKNVLLSLLSFLLLPTVSGAITIVIVPKPGDLFGFTESFISFIIIQFFFFFRFRSCLREKGSIAID